MTLIFYFSDFTPGIGKDTVRAVDGIRDQIYVDDGSIDYGSYDDEIDNVRADNNDQLTAKNFNSN